MCKLKGFLIAVCMCSVLVFSCSLLVSLDSSAKDYCMEVAVGE